MHFIPKSTAAVLALGFSVNAAQIPGKGNALEARAGDWSSAITVTVFVTTIPDWCTASSGLPVPAPSSPATVAPIPVPAPPFQSSFPAGSAPTGSVPAGSNTAGSAPASSPPSSTASVGTSVQVSCVSVGPGVCTIPAPVPLSTSVAATSGGVPISTSSGLATSPTGAAGNSSSPNTSLTATNASAGTPTGPSSSQSASYPAPSSIIPGSSASTNQVVLGLAFAGVLANAALLMA